MRPGFHPPYLDAKLAACLFPSNLLVAMTRNKLVEQVRRHRSDRRDYRRLESHVATSLDGRSAAAPAPSRLLAGRELLETGPPPALGRRAAVGRLAAEGWGWAEIGARIGSTAEACRKPIREASMPFSVAFDPDGRYLLKEGPGNTVKVWDLWSGLSVGENGLGCKPAGVNTQANRFKG